MLANQACKIKVVLEKGSRPVITLLEAKTILQKQLVTLKEIPSVVVPFLPPYPGVLSGIL